jgi:hypothetical protein
MDSGKRMSVRNDRRRGSDFARKPRLQKKTRLLAERDSSKAVLQLTLPKK